MGIDGTTIVFFLLAGFVIWRLTAVLGSHKYDSKNTSPRSFSHSGNNLSSGVRYQFSKINRNGVLKKYMNRYSEWFSLKGKISGLNYWNRIISVIFIFLFGVFLIFIVWPLTLLIIIKIMQFEIILRAMLYFSAFLLISLFVIIYWVLIATLVKRCRDIGLHIGLGFLVALTVWMVIGVIILGLLPSNDQKN